MVVYCCSDDCCPPSCSGRLVELLLKRCVSGLGVGCVKCEKVRISVKRCADVCKKGVGLLSTRSLTRFTGIRQVGYRSKTFSLGHSEPSEECLRWPEYMLYCVFHGRGEMHCGLWLSWLVVQVASVTV